MPRSRIKRPSPGPMRDLLLALLDYDPISGVLCWAVDFEWRKEGSVATWKAKDRSGYSYLTINIDNETWVASRIIWLLVTGMWPRGLVDHRNRDSFDNSWLNLRDATYAGNTQNRKLDSRNKTGFQGVSFNSRSGLYAARIRHRRREIGLGAYQTAEEASKAYELARSKYHHYVDPTFTRRVRHG